MTEGDAACSIIDPFFYSLVKHFDVFNGDADGICALHQLRLAMPLDSILVTGVKRDITLLQRVPAEKGDSVTVLDISLDANRAGLMELLERGVSVEYFDHHFSGEVPQHAGFRSFIDPAPDTCTGILVDRYLGGTYRRWAIVAAFGDDVVQAAMKLSATAGLSAAQTGALQELGECLNYNGYGECEEDLIAPPLALYATLHRYSDPFQFMHAEPLFQKIREARTADLHSASQIQPQISLPCGRIWILPDAAWSRRVHGAYGNLLARTNPQQAHAVLSPHTQGGYRVSVRAPLITMRGADKLCRLFLTGGGRSAAAGINLLPHEELPAFIRAFDDIFCK